MPMIGSGSCAASPCGQGATEPPGCACDDDSLDQSAGLARIMMAVSFYRARKRCAVRRPTAQRRIKPASRAVSTWQGPTMTEMASLDASKPRRASRASGTSRSGPARRAGAELLRGRTSHRAASSARA